MNNNPDFSIGFSTNLVRGLNPNWQPQKGLLNILYSAEHQAMDLKPVEPVEHRGSWSYPAITLHETALDLLDELIPYEIVKPSSDIDAPSFGPGALLAGAVGSEAFLEILSKTIGVDLTKPELSYALVKLVRVDGADNHASEVGGILVHARRLPAYPGTKCRSSSTRSWHRARTSNRKRQACKRLLPRWCCAARP